jgi:hypothetical protein
LEKTHITNPKINPATFLGTEVSISSHVYFTKGKQGQKHRAVSQIRLMAPMHRIYKKLSEAGFMDMTAGKGTPKLIWYHNDKESIIKLYNSVLRGYLNYYSFAHNYSRLAASLTHILKGSCAKLLAAKFTLRDVARVLNKFGTDLKGKDKTGFYQPPRLRRPSGNFI